MQRALHPANNWLCHCTGIGSIGQRAGAFTGAQLMPEDSGMKGVQPIVCWTASMLDSRRIGQRSGSEITVAMHVG
jgi:hypothetical protein